jgi:hypothetical protein
VGDVVRVLSVQLDDLQLGQQQVGGVQGEAGIAERGPEIQRVAHDQPVDHHVHRPSRRGGEIHLPVPVEVVEHAVGDAAAALQVRGDLPAPLARAGQVDVLAGAQPRREVRAEHADPEAAEQPHREPRRGRPFDEHDRLGQWVVSRCGHPSLLLAAVRVI